MAKRKSGLGKGLGALLENSETDITSSSPSIKADSAGSVSKISINNIEANPFQPRSEFEKEALVDLANSIKEHGIIQPITVRLFLSPILLFFLQKELRLLLFCMILQAWFRFLFPAMLLRAP